MALQDSSTCDNTHAVATRHPGAADECLRLAKWHLPSHLAPVAPSERRCASGTIHDGPVATCVPKTRYCAASSSAEIPHDVRTEPCCETQGHPAPALDEEAILCV